MKDTLDGYTLAREIFENIGSDPDHEISIEDMLRVLSFWGVEEGSPRNTQIGFVQYCALDRLKKILNQALVWDNHDDFDRVVQLINSRKLAE
jgi:hypothetical protein